MTSSTAKANAARREAIHKIASEITGRMVDQNCIIEIGFAAMLSITYPDWKSLPREQIKQLRMAFFGGAQHLFGSIMTMLDPGSEPTERDLRRMELISHELDTYIEEFKQENKITDPDIGPEQGAKQ